LFTESSSSAQQEVRDDGFKTIKLDVITVIEHNTKPIQ